MPEKVKSHFSRMLKNLIQQRGITFEELASHIGVTKQTVSNYCLGKSVPNYDVLIKIAEYFSVSGDFLLTGVRVQDKADSEKLGLSGEAIRLLKACDKKTFDFIDAFLSDTNFYSILSEAVHSIKFENTNVLMFKDNQDKSKFNFTITYVEHSKENIQFPDTNFIDFKMNGNENIKAIKSYFENMFLKKVNIKILNKIPKMPDFSAMADQLAGNSERTAK